MKNTKTLTLREQIESNFDNGMYDTEYQEYIMKHSAGDRIICNGDMLIEACEDGYLFEEFIDSIVYAGE